MPAPLQPAIGSYASKRAALERAGVLVADTPRAFAPARRTRKQWRRGGNAPQDGLKKTAGSGFT
jgi:hypothetical protein